MMADIPLPDIFTQIWNYKLGGIQVVPIIIAIGAIYLIYIYFIKGHKTLPPYKKRELKKELKDYNYEDISIGFPVNKTLHYFTPVGKVMVATFHNGKAKMVKIKDKFVIDSSAEKELIRKLQVRKLGMLSGILAWLGFGIRFWDVPESAIVEDDKNIYIDKNLDYVIDNGTYIFGDVAKTVAIENPTYIKNRENELEALLNWYPRMIYTQELTASKTAEDREKANIEKEKYKGQTDE